MAEVGELDFPYPLGVTPAGTGVNVAVYSSVAQSVVFCTFDASGKETARPLTQVDGDIWHAVIDGIEPGQEYGLSRHRALCALRREPV